MQARLPWDLEGIDTLTAVAEEMAENPDLHHCKTNEHPGQHWSCYKTQRPKSSDLEQTLETRLRGPLTPSTSQATLPYSETTRNALLPIPTFLAACTEHLVAGEMHCGSQYPQLWPQ